MKYNEKIGSNGNWGISTPIRIYLSEILYGYLLFLGSCGKPAMNTIFPVSPHKNA